MELVETADISAVLEDAMHEASDPKQKNALSNMLLELIGVTCLYTVMSAIVWARCNFVY